MDKNRIEGKVKEMKGKAERKIGELTGDKKIEMEGMKDQIKGKVQHAVGKAKDSSRKAASKSKRAA